MHVLCRRPSYSSTTVCDVHVFGVECVTVCLVWVCVCASNDGVHDCECTYVTVSACVNMCMCSCECMFECECACDCEQV